MVSPGGIAKALLCHSHSYSSLRGERFIRGPFLPILLYSGKP